MPAPGRKLEKQLERWGSRVDRLVARSLAQGAPSNFGALMRIDEIKVLYALALARLEEWKEAPESDWARLEVEAEQAMEELDAAFKKRPGPRSLRTGLE